MDIKKIAKNNKFIRLQVYRILNFLEKRGYVRGKRNMIKNHGIKIGTRICINGDYNTLNIEDYAVLKNCLIKIKGNNNRIELKKKCYIDGATLYIEDNSCSIIIGENTFVGASHFAVSENNSTILIDEDCMISSNVNIRTGDSHSIIEIESSERINYASSIHIRDHVWIGEGAKILKGVKIKENCIVSTGSIVTKSFESNLLIGGVPARILKENVTWDKNRI